MNSAHSSPLGIPTDVTSPDSNNATNEVGRAFQETNWELVRAASSHDLPAKEELVRRYGGPILAYSWRAWELRRHAFPNAEGMLDGDVLAASFMTDVFLSEKFLSRGDPDKGKFRSYVVGALENHVVSKCRFYSAKIRGGGTLLASQEELHNLEDSGGLSPVDAMDNQMLMDGMALVTKTLRSEWVAKGKQDQFDVLFDTAMRREESDDHVKEEAAGELLGIPRGTVPFEKRLLREAHAAGVHTYLCDTCGIEEGTRIFTELSEMHAAFKEFLKRRRAEKIRKKPRISG